MRLLSACIPLSVDGVFGGADVGGGGGGGGGGDGDGGGGGVP